MNHAVIVPNQIAVLQLCKADAATQTIWARAALEEPDKAREIMDYETAKPEFQEWSQKFRDATMGKSLGNIRAMHNPKHLAGKVVDMVFNDDHQAVDVCIKILDPVDWTKVEEGGYTGLSIGGGYLKKWKDPANPTLTRYTPIIREISLVDSPCMGGARFLATPPVMELTKRDGSVDQVVLHGIPRSFGELLPPRTFGDLQKAFIPRAGLRAFGRRVADKTVATAAHFEKPVIAEPSDLPRGDYENRGRRFTDQAEPDIFVPGQTIEHPRGKTFHHQQMDGRRTSYTTIRGKKITQGEDLERSAPTGRLRKTAMTEAQRDKVALVMHEAKHGKLRSWRGVNPETGKPRKGPKVTDRRQAIAIALNQARRMDKAEGDGFDLGKLVKAVDVGDLLSRARRIDQAVATNSRRFAQRAAAAGAVGMTAAAGAGYAAGRLSKPDDANLKKPRYMTKRAPGGGATLGAALQIAMRQPADLEKAVNLSDIVDAAARGVTRARWAAQPAIDRLSSAAGSAASRAQMAAGHAGAYAQGVGRRAAAGVEPFVAQARDATQDLGNRASEAAESIRTKAEPFVARARDAAGTAGYAAAGAGRRAGAAARTAMDATGRHPGAALAGAAGVGAGLGFATGKMMTPPADRMRKPRYMTKREPSGAVTVGRALELTLEKAATREQATRRGRHIGAVAGGVIGMRHGAAGMATGAAVGALTGHALAGRKHDRDTQAQSGGLADRLTERQHAERIAAAKARWHKEGHHDIDAGFDAQKQIASRALLGRANKMAAVEGHRQNAWLGVHAAMHGYDKARAHLPEDAKLMMEVPHMGGVLYNPEGIGVDDFDKDGRPTREMYHLHPSEVDDFVKQRQRKAAKSVEKGTPIGLITSLADSSFVTAAELEAA